MRYDDAVTVVGGRAEGLTVGGNLSLIAGSLGTTSSYPAPGGIVLLEDELERFPDRHDADPPAPKRLPRRGAAIICGTYQLRGQGADPPGPRRPARDLGVPMSPGRTSATADTCRRSRSASEPGWTPTLAR